MTIPFPARRPPRATAAVLATLVATIATGAHAQPPPHAPPATPDLDEENGELGTRRPAALDRRGGHVPIAAKVGLAVPGGSIVSGVPAGQLFGVGPAFGGSVGIGLGRHATLDASGSYTLLSGTGRCEACGASAIDVGLGLTYHLAQGIAVDPWVSYGLGFRTATYEVPAGQSRAPVSGERHHGLDVARLGVGADFFPIPSFGVGPYLEASLGAYLARPEPDPGGATYAFVALGARVVFDPVALGPERKPAKSAARRARAGLR